MATMLPSTTTETHVLISICTPESAYPRFYDAILSTKYFDDETELAYFGYRYYSPELGRFVNRDPIGEEDGVNLYEFVRNAPVNLTDFLGMEWSEPDRQKESRARTECDCGDKVEELAMMIKLNASEFVEWLRDEDGKGLPQRADEEITEHRVFSVPNTGYVDASSYSWGPFGWGLIAFKNAIVDRWQNTEGLKVIYSGIWRTTKQMILGHLGSDDIYKFTYIGHGAAGCLTAIRDPGASGASAGIICPGITPFTQYGIAEMNLMACSSDDSGYLWKRNVSRDGMLMTVVGRGCAWRLVLRLQNGVDLGP